MDLQEFNIHTPVISHTRTDLLSVWSNTSFLSLSIVDRLMDLNIAATFHVITAHVEV